MMNLDDKISSVKQQIEVTYNHIDRLKENLKTLTANLRQYEKINERVKELDAITEQASGADNGQTAGEQPEVL
jgi:uncharacterized protein YigA (DUF484 family)